MTRISSSLSLPHTVGVREFTRNIVAFKKVATKKPVLVLSNNSANFVAVSPAMYQAMVQALEAQKYAKLFEETVMTRRANIKIPWRKAKELLK